VPPLWNQRVGLFDVCHRSLRPGPSLDPGGTLWYAVVRCGTLWYVEVVRAGYEEIIGMQVVFPLPGSLRRASNYIN